MLDAQVAAFAADEPWDRTVEVALAQIAEIVGTTTEPKPSADVREELEEWSFEHRPVLSLNDGSITTCKCMDRLFDGGEDWDQHIADAVLSRYDLTPKAPNQTD